MQVTKDEPILPAELERLIFGIFLQDNPREIVNILPVAQRVRAWFEPPLYSVFDQRLHAPHYQRFPGETGPSPTYSGKYIKHLLTTSSAPLSTIELFLSSCPNLIGLRLWPISPLNLFLPILGKEGGPRLQHLSCNLGTLNPTDYLSSTFEHLTHLDVVELASDRERSWGRLPSLPRLTHLSFTFLKASKSPEALAQVVREALIQCDKLKMLVLIKGYPNGVHLYDFFSEVREVKDERLVLLERLWLLDWDWVNPARGKPSFWEIADNFIVAERTGRLGSVRWIDEGVYEDIQNSLSGRTGGKG